MELRLYRVLRLEFFQMNTQTRKQSKAGNSLYTQQPNCSAMLVTGSFNKVSALPLCVEENEWLASNTIDFLQYIGLLLGSIIEFCHCDKMYGPNVEYYWVDSKGKSASYPACEYFNLSLNWVQGYTKNEDVFPTRTGINL